MRTRQTLTVALATSLCLEEVAGAIMPLLGVSFTERDSSYFAGRYLLGKAPDGEEIRIYRNYDPVDNSPIYKQAADCSVLVELRQTERNVEKVVQQIREEAAIACRAV